MRYEVGNKIRVKSIDWYNTNKDELGEVKCGNRIFTYPMTRLCGKTVTIWCVNTKDGYYVIHEDDGYDSWTDEMFEGLVEEENKFGTASNPIEIKSNANCLIQERVGELATKIDKELPSGNQNIWELPDGYIFKDENDNIINATKIILEKKKKEYPKTYEECCKVLGVDSDNYLSIRNLYCDDGEENTTSYEQDLLGIFDSLWELRICRDVYWKIAGEEMGLGKPWEPNFLNPTRETRYFLFCTGITIEKGQAAFPTNKILIFPTEEMRDAFYNNFRELIELCKELL